MAAAAAECIPPELLQPGRSVYDDDDFDINTRDAVDLSRVHRGKKNKGGDAKKLLDDKRDLGKNRFQKCSMVSETWVRKEQVSNAR